jgi:hypothetical protein
MVAPGQITLQEQANENLSCGYGAGIAPADTGLDILKGKET